MIDITKYRKSNYLRASDLTARRTRVRIQSAGEEEIGATGEQKIILQLTTATLKPLICGPEKLEVLVAAFGADETTWSGKVIVLVKTKRRVKNQIMDSIMIEVPPQPPTATAAVDASAEPAPPPAESTLVYEDEADLV
jgi:hypothetical protein